MFDQLSLGRSWDPFLDLERIQEEMNRLLVGSRRIGVTSDYPPVNLWVGDEDVVVTAEVPGIGEQDLELSIVNDALTLRGTRTPPTLQDGHTCHR